MDDKHSNIIVISRGKFCTQYIGPIVRNRNLWFLLHRDRHYMYLQPICIPTLSIIFTHWKTKVKPNDDGVSKFVKEISENSRRFVFGEINFVFSIFWYKLRMMVDGHVFSYSSKGNRSIKTSSKTFDNSRLYIGLLLLRKIDCLIKRNGYCAVWSKYIISVSHSRACYSYNRYIYQGCLIILYYWEYNILSNTLSCVSTSFTI